MRIQDSGLVIVVVFRDYQNILSTLTPRLAIVNHEYKRHASVEP